MDENIIKYMQKYLCNYTKSLLHVHTDIQVHIRILTPSQARRATCFIPFQARVQTWGLGSGGNTMVLLGSRPVPLADPGTETVIK